MLVKVKNLNGIDKSQISLFDISWKNWWEKEQGRSLPAKCSRDGCNQASVDVFPVQKVDGGRLLVYGASLSRLWVQKNA